VQQRKKQILRKRKIKPKAKTKQSKAKKHNNKFNIKILAMIIKITQLHIYR
jgi:hypothetical protein